MVRLKAEFLAAVKAYSCTHCHFLQIINQEKGFQNLMCFCMGVLDIRVNLFPMKTVKHGKRLLREVLQSPPSEISKTH